MGSTFLDSKKMCQLQSGCCVIYYNISPITMGQHALRELCLTMSISFAKAGLLLQEKNALTCVIRIMIIVSFIVGHVRQCNVSSSMESLSAFSSSSPSSSFDTNCMFIYCLCDLHSFVVQMNSTHIYIYIHQICRWYKI